MRSATSLMEYVTLSAALIVLGGCASKPNDNVGATLSPLEIPVFDCQTKQASCLSGAKDASEALACNEAMGQCLLDSAQKLLDLAKAVFDCQGTAAECVVNGGKQAVAGCRQDFLACVGIDPDAGIGLPPHGGSGAPPFAPPPGGPVAGGPGDGHGRGPQGPGGGFGMPPGPGAGGSNWPDLGDAGVPVPPFAGAPAAPTGPHAPGLPVSDPPAFGCVMELRGCVSSGKTPEECAKAARECLRAQPTGFPMGH